MGAGEPSGVLEGRERKVRSYGDMVWRGCMMFNTENIGRLSIEPYHRR